MKNQTRIKALTKHLTPLQIVMLDVEEARRHGSVARYTQALAKGAVVPKWRDRMAGGSARSMERKVSDEAETHECRQAAFLFRLAVETWLEVPARFETWNLALGTSYLLHSSVVDGCDGKGSLEDLDRTVSLWGRFVASHLFEINATRLSNQMIADTYFDGQAIEMPEEQAELTRLADAFAAQFDLARRANVALNHDTPSPGHGNSAASDPVRVRAGEIANLRADTARVHVLYRLGESKAAERIVNSLVAARNQMLA